VVCGQVWIRYSALHVGDERDCDIPHTATAVGVRPGEERLTLHAPYGLADLLGAIVRPNKTQITRDIYEAKTARWKATWPDLAVIGWDEEPR
jgi:uncharacterized protein